VAPPLADHQLRVLRLLEAVVPAGEEEAGFLRRIRDFVCLEPLWWYRETLPGHVTGSAFVVDPALERVLLLRHRILDRWLQPGGHDQGERDPACTALREAREESGLRSLAFFGGRAAVFDLDVHSIPARGPMPAHEHLDLRFLLTADPAEPLRPGPGESAELAWVSWEEIPERMPEAGARRVQAKLAAIRAQLPGGRSSK